VVQTNIGDIIERTIGGEQVNLFVSGVMIDGEGEPSDISIRDDVSIDTGEKLKAPNGAKSTAGLLKEFCSSRLFTETMKRAGIQNVADAGNFLISRLKDLQSVRAVLLPFRPKKDCIVYGADKVTGADIRTSIEYVKWTIEPSTYRVKGEIITLGGENAAWAQEGGTTRHKIEFKDYGTKFRMSGIEQSTTSDKVRRECIKVAPDGMIHPIIFKDAKNNLAIDSTGLYMAYINEEVLIGTWKNNAIEILESVKKSIQQMPAYKELAPSIPYIAAHSRFIAPYGYMEPNIVEC
jgi:hypothetical protein